MLQVGLLGADNTGKTRLAAALRIARPAFRVSIIDCRQWVDDRALQQLWMAQLRGFDLALLMGLDLPRPNGANLNCERVRESVDQLLRQALAQGGVPYKVIYGTGSERLRDALNALDVSVACGTASSATAINNTEHTAQDNAKWVWTCDKCSDPKCERRLLSDLLASRTDS